MLVKNTGRQPYIGAINLANSIATNHPIAQELSSNVINIPLIFEGANSVSNVLPTTIYPADPIPAKTLYIDKSIHELEYAERKLKKPKSSMDKNIAFFLPKISPTSPINKAPSNIPNSHELNTTPVIDGVKLYSLTINGRVPEIIPALIESYDHPNIKRSKIR